MAAAAGCLVLPAALDSRQRALVHAVAEALGLAHASTGDGAQRRVSLGSGAPRTALGDGPLSDAELAAAVSRHLGLDAGPHFAAAAAAGPTQAARGGRAGGRGGGGAGPTPPPPPPRIGLDEYVALTSRLLDLERDAEVEAAHEATSLCSPETAQARGRALLNLRCSGAEGGLLGRTLLTLVPNKGHVAGGPPPELPPHKFGPHDVVALRPHRGPADGPPLGTGVVYRRVRRAAPRALPPLTARAGRLMAAALSAERWP